MPLNENPGTAIEVQAQAKPCARCGTPTSEFYPGSHYLQVMCSRASETRTFGKAIKDGRLVKQPCEKCGNPKVDAHHDDYSKPLEVRWLCLLHHKQHHGYMKEVQVA